jgi:hypothetical protein
MLHFHGASKRAASFVAGFAAIICLMPAARAEDPVAYEIILKDQTFVPAEIKVPAGKPFALKVKNENDRPAEFESADMKIEKIIAGHQEIVARVKAMSPGTYEFVDEYQEDVARGRIVVQ